MLAERATAEVYELDLSARSGKARSCPRTSVADHKIENLNRTGTYVSSASTDACPYRAGAAEILARWVQFEDAAGFEIEPEDFIHHFRLLLVGN